MAILQPPSSSKNVETCTRFTRHSKNKKSSTKSNHALIARDEDNFKNDEEDIRKIDLEIQLKLADFYQVLQESEIKRKKADERLKQE